MLFFVKEEKKNIILLENEVTSNGFEKWRGTLDLLFLHSIYSPLSLFVRFLSIHIFPECKKYNKPLSFFNGVMNSSWGLSSLTASPIFFKNLRPPTFREHSTLNESFTLSLFLFILKVYTSWEYGTRKSGKSKKGDTKRFRFITKLSFLLFFF